MAESIDDILKYGELAQASYDTDNFSVQQKTNFEDDYEIKATSSDYGIGTASGFDAILFEEKDNPGKYILAIRGTDDGFDLIADAALGVAGITFSQQVSMINFYKKLIEDNIMSSTTNLTVTGHSLGGFLAQLFTAQYGSIVDHAYTYNVPGVGGVMMETLDDLGVPVDVSSSKITNIYAEEGLEVELYSKVVFEGSMKK